MFPKGWFYFMITIFAEKPDMARRIASAMSTRVAKQQHYIDVEFNGKKYCVTWGYGHLCELYDVKDYTSDYKWNTNNYPFFPSEFKLKLKQGINAQQTKTNREHFAELKNLFNSSEYIINATDADREGELIFAYVYEFMKCKTPWKRLWLNSTENNAIRTALANLKDSSEMLSLQNAGRCRSEADWLIGINATVLSTLSFGSYGNMMNVGRVQTPTLAFLVNRENEIQNFVSTPFWTVKGIFETSKKEKYEGTLKKPERFNTKEEADSFVSKLDKNTSFVSKCEKVPERKKPPLLFDLNALQMQANSDFGFSAQKTLDIAQKLYEMQYITYPRTTSKYLPEDLKQGVYDVLDSFVGEYATWSKKIYSTRHTVSKPYFDNTKVESHYAIIPTTKVPSGLSSDEEKIYDLIAKSIIRIFYPDAIFNKTTIETDVSNQIFVSKGSSLQELGWMEVGYKVKDDTNLPNISNGEKVATNEINIVEGKTEPPKRYTDKSLLNAMETAGKFVDSEELRLIMKDSGLGTPATRAGIIEKLIHSGYVVRDKKALVPTEKGIYLIKNLPCEELKSPEMTGAWEKRINDVENGKDSFASFIKDIEEQTNKICITITENKVEDKERFNTQDNSAVGACPLCGGDVVKKSWGFGCSNYNTTKCSFSISSSICGKKMTDAIVKKLLSTGSTGKISGFKSKAGKSFSATIKLIDGKTEFEF